MPCAREQGPAQAYKGDETWKRKRAFSADEILSPDLPD